MVICPDYFAKIVAMEKEDFKQWRERNGLTQAEVAQALEVTEMTVYRWESGKAPILKTVELALQQIETDLKRKKR